MNQEQRDKLALDTAEWLKDHAYTELTNANGVEVWRCQKPKTIHLAFDICITRFGIAVFGDIGSLMFSVGASYGVPFLAGTDGDYIYGKLEPSSKTTEFDRPGFIQRVEDAICDLLSNSCESAPEWMADYSKNQGRGKEIEEWLLAHLEDAAFEAMHHSALVVALREAWAFEGDSSKAHEWLTDHEELLEVSDTWEWDLRKPTDSVLRRLARVRHAARMIMAQKAATKAETVVAIDQSELDRMYERTKSLIEGESSRFVVDLPRPFMSGYTESGNCPATDLYSFDDVKSAIEAAGGKVKR